LIIKTRFFQKFYIHTIRFLYVLIPGGIYTGFLFYIQKF